MPDPWSPVNLDALAGATVAGHVLECGTQVTGGNFSFFAELLDADPAALDAVGFPIVEVAAVGSSVVTKHPGTGGAVTVETVTEQLLYECTGAQYGGPDVVTRFDTITLEQDGPDRVRVSGVRGFPPGPWLKVATNRLGGFRSSVTIPLSGLDVERKAAVLQRQLAPMLAQVAEARVELASTDSPDADVQEEASALLHVTVKDGDRDKVAKAFTAPLIELALASIPGFFTTTAPPSPSPYVVFSPAWVRVGLAPQQVTLPDGTVEQVSSSVPAGRDAAPATAAIAEPAPPAPEPAGPTRRVPLGRVAGPRSGDKGGSATRRLRTQRRRLPVAGVLPHRRAAAGAAARGRRAARHPGAAAESARRAVPDARSSRRRGRLGARFDAQAKGLGEWLRSRLVDVPEALLTGGA